MAEVNDFMKSFMSSILKDGMQLGDAIVILIDDEHRDKVSELINEDPATYYALETALGIDPYGDEYYPTSDIQGLHPDHFLLSIKCKNRSKEFKQKVYSLIDKFYDNRVEEVCDNFD